jgi:uncharacterized protein (DUF433 family)
MTITDEELLTRITINPAIFGGKPVIRGMRIAVEHILGMLAAGSTVQEILEGYPFLEKEDVQACLMFAYRAVAHERVTPIDLAS